MADLFGEATSLPVYIKTQDLAELLGLTTRRIRQLNKEGMAQYKRGTYILREALQWYIEHIKRGHATQLNTEEQRRELLYEQTVKTRLENEETRRILLRADVVSATHNQMAATLAASLDALGPRMGDQLAGIPDGAEVKRLIFAETRRIRDEFARHLTESIDDMLALELAEPETDE